jgi:hypothetical protein
MSGYAMEWAIEVGEAKQLSADARTVLTAVAYFANHRHGLAWCSRHEIMAKTAMGHNRVKRAVAEIEAADVIPMARRRNRITWGPFPILPPKGLSTRGSTSGRAGVHSGPVDIRRAVAASGVYRATARALSGPTGVREPLRVETTSRDECERCGGAGVLLGDEIRDAGGDRRSIVACPCRGNVKP